MEKQFMKFNRRTFVKAAAGGLAAVSGTPLSSSLAQTVAAGQGLETIRVEGKMGGALRLPDGRLMAWWTAGKKGLKEDPDEIHDPNIPQKAFARYSSDHGYTWSQPELLWDFPREKGIFSRGVALVDRRDVIHLFGLHYLGTGPQGFYDWENAKSFVYHVMSLDGGKTWRQPRYCDFGYLYTGATNSVIQLKSGRILLPVSYFSRRKTGKFVSNISISDDGGKSWRPSRGQCEVDTGGSLLETGANEPVCIQLKDGRVWMLIRTQSGYQYESFSADGGDTWAEPVPSRFVSSNAPGAFLRLRDGRMVFVWSNCMSPYNQAGIMTSYDRQVLAAAISADEGKSWQGYREVARVKEGEQQVAYPRLTQAGDGAIICSTGNRLVRLQPDWLKATGVEEDFQEGLANWMTLGCEGAEVVPHPDRSGSQALALRKPKRDIPAAASLNFPFGVRGQIRLRLLLEPGFRDGHYYRLYYYLGLTDFFSMPRLPAFIKGKPAGGWGLFPEGSRFLVRISPDGVISAGSELGLFQTEFRPTRARLGIGKWHTLGLHWDCAKKLCSLRVDERHVADLPQLSRAVGLCYLRLWAQHHWPQQEGILVESVKVQVET